MKYLLCFALIITVYPIFSASFFLYIEETTDGIPGIYLEQSRIGIFDTFFDWGHIIFDDTQDIGAKNLFATLDFNQPIKTSLNGEADYLIAVKIDTKTAEKAQNIISLKSTVQYILISVRNGIEIGRGDFILDNYGRENETNKELYAFDLGKKVATQINQIWQEYMLKN